MSAFGVGVGMTTGLVIEAMMCGGRASEDKRENRTKGREACFNIQSKVNPHIYVGIPKENTKATEEAEGEQAMTHHKRWLCPPP